MSCQCSFLDENQFPQIADTFNQAFADYYLKSTRKAEEWLYNRTVKNAVDYSRSVGVFDGDKMVGFTLIGIDQWQGHLAAFDAGTGIIPDYRGKGLARKMFSFAVPKLCERGVKKFLLEVLQVNDPAIKAYQKSGFRITRELDCFGFDPAVFQPDMSPQPGLEIKPLPQEQILNFSDYADWQPSWENSFSTIRRIPDEVVINGAFVSGECVGVLAYYPLLNWIMSLLVRKEFRRRGIATALLSHFVEDYDREYAQINMVNVDHSDTAMLAFLKKAGFKLYTSQFEMELEL